MIDKTDKKTKGKGSCSRYFSGVSYLTLEEVVAVLQSKANSVRAWACIDHDKDEKEPHRHFVVRTHSSWSPSQVAKWFSGHVDSSGKSVNTMVEIVFDRKAILDYLTHENQPDKYHYSHSDIVDHGISELAPPVDCKDDSWEIIQSMLDGVSTRELARLYGRDFIYHYGSYFAIVERIREEEGGSI